MYIKRNKEKTSQYTINYGKYYNWIPKNVETQFKITTLVNHYKD